MTSSLSPPPALPLPRATSPPAPTAARLYATYSAIALATHPLPAPPSLDLPILPDSEACVGGVKRTLRDHGVCFPCINGMCNAVYCYCGVRLQRLMCARGAFGADGRLVPLGDTSRRLERDCSQLGHSGCSRCLSQAMRCQACHRPCRA